MKDHRVFAEGAGAGAALVFAITDAACLWQADRIARWLSRENGQVRQRRGVEKAQRIARLSPDYLDACRAAGM